MKKLFALALAAVMSMSAFALAGCSNEQEVDRTTDKKEASGDVSSSYGSEGGEAAPADNNDGEVYMPTFMYFVSGSDEKYDEAMAVVEELKSEYGDKIKFDIHNIDETPEDKENFPVDGTTPALIMLNTSNDISAMEFMCTDKDKLKTDIDNALNGEN